MFLKIGSWTISNEPFDLRRSDYGTELLLADPAADRDSVPVGVGRRVEPVPVGEPVPVSLATIEASGSDTVWCGRLGEAMRDTP